MSRVNRKRGLGRGLPLGQCGSLGRSRRKYKREYMRRLRAADPGYAERERIAQRTRDQAVRSSWPALPPRTPALNADQPARREKRAPCFFCHSKKRQMQRVERLIPTPEGKMLRRAVPWCGVC